MTEQEKETKALHKKIQEFKDRKFKYESHLESYFSRKVKEAGGWPMKFNPTVVSGLPDQIIFYHGVTWLVELKMPKGTLQPVQKVVHKKFEDQGFKVWVIRTKEEVAAFIEQMLIF